VAVAAAVLVIAVLVVVVVMVVVVMVMLMAVAVAAAVMFMIDMHGNISFFINICLLYYTKYPPQCQNFYFSPQSPYRACETAPKGI
jgi:type IV secretory pathway VirB3-like protein